MHPRCFALAWSLALTLGVGASAQPTDLDRCLSTSTPTCVNVFAGAVQTECGRLFDSFSGRIAWWPLRCVGPIVVAVENVALWDLQFPLYVEVVPLLQPAAPCFLDPGYVIFVVHGVSHGCGGWEVSSAIDITSVVPLGSSYAIRIHFFDSSFRYSPSMDCIRVTAQPATSPVEELTWTHAKSLYR
jgi:hypothetical protein